MLGKKILLDIRGPLQNNKKKPTEKWNNIKLQA